MDMRKVWAMQKANKERIKKICSKAEDRSGIYAFYRLDKAAGLRYAYVGQAQKVLSRLADHLKGYQHIDLSIKKHGLHSPENPNGWYIRCEYCHKSELDTKEREYISWYANNGYQLYNHTTGGQDNQKRGLKETVRKGYLEGLHKGYEKARKEVAHLFELHLTYDVKKQGNKNQEKAKAKFEEFINAAEVDV